MDVHLARPNGPTKPHGGVISLRTLEVPPATRHSRWNATGCPGGERTTTTATNCCDRRSLSHTCLPCSPSTTVHTLHQRSVARAKLKPRDKKRVYMKSEGFLDQELVYTEILQSKAFLLVLIQKFSLRNIALQVQNAHGSPSFCVVADPPPRATPIPTPLGGREMVAIPPVGLGFPKPTRHRPTTMAPTQTNLTNPFPTAAGLKRTVIRHTKTTVTVNVVTSGGQENRPKWPTAAMAHPNRIEQHRPSQERTQLR